MKKVKTVRRQSQLLGEVGGSITGDSQANCFERILNQKVVGLDILQSPFHYCHAFITLSNSPVPSPMRVTGCVPTCAQNTALSVYVWLL